MNVQNAFLHGDLNEEVYMKPPGFTSNDSTLAYCLHKSLYGLCQAPSCWFAKLASFLKGFDYLQSYSGYPLFTYTKGTIQLNVLVYVNDLIIYGNDSSTIINFQGIFKQVLPYEGSWCVKENI